MEKPKTMIQDNGNKEGIHCVYVGKELAEEIFQIEELDVLWNDLVELGYIESKNSYYEESCNRGFMISGEELDLEYLIFCLEENKIKFEEEWQ